MKNITKKILFSLLMSLILHSFSVTTRAQERNLDTLNAQSMVLSDGHSGQILYEVNEDIPIDVGMVSKLLTIYLIYQAMENEEFKINDLVPISDKAYELSQDYSLLNVPLRQDFDYTVEELLQAVAIRHANGALLALVEKTGMNEAQFIEKMNETLLQWNLDDNVILNINGMSDQYDPAIMDSEDEGKTNQMTAKAMATIAYRLISDYPEFLELTEKAKVTFKQNSEDPFVAENVNPLLKDDGDQGLKGLSVGFSPNDGYSQIIVQEKDEQQLIAVVLGVDEEMDNPYDDVVEILSYGFNNFVINHLLMANHPTLELSPFKVVNGEKQSIDIVYEQSFDFYQEKQDGPIKYSYSFENKEGEVNVFELNAPIQQGESIGTVIVEMEDVRMSYLPTSYGNQINIIANESIAENRSIFTWFNNQWSNLNEQMVQLRKFFIKLFN